VLYHVSGIALSQKETIRVSSELTGVAGRSSQAHRQDCAASAD